MKITIQDQDRRVEVECKTEDINGTIDEVCNLLVAWGFHPESVKTGILEKADNYV